MLRHIQEFSFSSSQNLLGHTKKKEEEIFYTLPVKKKTGQVVTPDSRCRTVCLLYLSRRV